MTNISAETEELIKSLRQLDIEDEDIEKKLNISLKETVPSTPGNTIEKSLANEFSIKFDEISKSLSEKIDKTSENIVNVNTTVTGLVDLIKSLTSVVFEQKTELESIRKENEDVLKNNSELRKSFSDAELVLNKIASFSPGLRSVSGASAIERFEKSNTGNQISKSQNFKEIHDKLLAKMDDAKYNAEFGQDISVFENSGKISDKLRKSIQDDLGLTVVE
jgi:hypothetical protein